MTDTWRQWEGHLLNGQFPLQRCLGESDHSAVFLTEPAGKPQRAIKFIATNPAEREQQLLRWKAAAAVSHPNLLSIFESGQCQLGDAGLLYVVVELAEEDLSQILPQRALLQAEAQEMLKPVVSALSHLHSRRLVHGSVRPSNIMAVGEKVKLSADTVRAVEKSAPRPAENDPYTAPETVRGEYSFEADVWSLGITIVETVTQQRPAWNRTQSGLPALPAALAEPFREIARNCLQVDPKQRWTAEQIAARLEGKQSPVTKPAASASTTTVPQRSDKGKPAKWPYVLALAVLVLVTALVLIWPTKSSQPSESKGSETQVQNQTPKPITGSSTAPREPKPSPGKGAKAPVAAATAETQPPQAVGSPPEKPPGYSLPPGVVHEVLPQVLPQARETITGKVRVRVKVEVDTSGNVVSASFDSPGPSKYFARLAMEAAQGWKFAPAQVDGRAVASQWLLRFGFTRRDTEVVPVRTAP